MKERIDRMKTETADLCAGHVVVRRSQPHCGDAPSSRLVASPNLWPRHLLLFMRCLPLICLGMTCFTGLAAPAATNNAAESAGTNAEDLLRSYLQIQEQLHNLQQADEKSREEADAAAR